MSFLSSFLNSLPNALGQGLAWGIMAIGVYITYKILDIADLTVDGSLATGGAVAAVLITMGWNPWLALLMAVIAGMLAGLVTGLLHTACGIPAILAGILTQLAFYSINLRIMAINDLLTLGEMAAKTKPTLPLNPDRNALLLTSRYVRELALRNPLLLLVILVALVIGVLYWFFGTELGSSLRATGANANMARAQGINTDVAKVLGLVVSNGLVAMSGALLAQYSGSATIDMGRGAIVIGLAAVIIGRVLFKRIFQNFALKLLSSVIGAIIYYTVITLVLRMGLESTDLKLLTAAVVAVFLSVPYWKKKYFSKKAKKGGRTHA